MKAYNHLFVSLDEFKEFLDGIEICCSDKLLVRIHSGIHTKDAMQELVNEIQSLLPNAVIIGCSTAKVICEGQIESGCLISITGFEECDLTLAKFACRNEDGSVKDENVLCEEVAKELVGDKEGFMLVFFPLSYYKIAKFVECMNQRVRGIKMYGGTAYTADEAYKTGESTAFVIAGTEVCMNSMVAVLISGPKLSVYQSTVCGAENVGRSYEITGVHEHYLDGIEEVDAAVWYEEQLGKEELEKNPQVVGIFPLVSDDASQIAYNVVYEPETSVRKSTISMFTEISAGRHFALGYFDPQKIVNQLDGIHHDMRKKPIEVIFAYDCLSRMWMLHDCAKWEVGQFYTTNMSGALLSGEISHVGGRNVYLNSTFIVAGLSENEDARVALRSKGLKNVSALQHNNEKMISYLLKTGNRQLNEQLTKQQDKMKKAMFYHAVLDLDNQTKFLYDSESICLDKIAVCTLKNERLIKLFLGQTAFYEELKEVFGEVRREFAYEGLHFYSYGDCSLMIAAEESIEEEQFVVWMKRVLEYLNHIQYKEFAFSYYCAVVAKEEELLNKVETVLQYAEKNKVAFARYRDIPKELAGVKEELHMLQVLREALVHDRVIPYFQGIYDNREKKITMYEALCRIKDEQGNLYYPNQFLTLAKEYNLYETLSVTMVRKVMEMFLDKDIKISINLNVQDIYDRDMLRVIFGNLTKAAHPENFMFEIVESEEVQDYQFIKQFADSIHDYGAKIAIDDFGSGFSNLLHIIRIDTDVLKIDGAIIKESCHDTRTCEFIEVINDWCVRQGKEVVGEFVENNEIQTVIEELGVAYSQGYLYAKPMPWEDCVKQSEGEKEA